MRIGHLKKSRITERAILIAETLPHNELPDPHPEITKIIDHRTSRRKTIKLIPEDFISFDQSLPEIGKEVDIFLKNKKTGIVKPLHQNPWFRVGTLEDGEVSLDLKFESTIHPVATMNMRIPEPGTYFWRSTDLAMKGIKQRIKDEEIYFIQVAASI